MARRQTRRGVGEGPWEEGIRRQFAQRAGQTLATVRRYRDVGSKRGCRFNRHQDVTPKMETPKEWHPRWG